MTSVEHHPQRLRSVGAATRGARTRIAVGRIRGEGKRADGDAMAEGDAAQPRRSEVESAARDRARLNRSPEQQTLLRGQHPWGSGSGLARTQRLVEMHGGTIDVESELGAGTTFAVRIPVA